MSIQNAPIREPIQPMPPVWSIWFQNLVTAFNALLASAGVINMPASRIPFGNAGGTGVDSSAALTFDGTKLDSPQARFGTDTDYTEIEADGTIRMVGAASVWNDINISLVPPQGGASAPAIIAFNGDSNLDCYAYSGTNPTPDEIHSSLEILHGYKEGSDLHFHVHAYPTNANTGDVKLSLRYTWFNRGTVPAAAVTVPMVLPMPGVAWQETTFASVLSGAGKNMGSRFVYSVFRDTTDVQDTYASNLAVTDMGLHYEIDQIGSREIFVK